MPELTPKEKRICKFLLLSLADKEIAFHCGCATGTIKNQIAVIKEKYHARNRVELALMISKES